MIDLSNMTTIKAGIKGVTQHQFCWRGGTGGGGVAWVGGKVLQTALSSQWSTRIELGL